MPARIPKRVVLEISKGPGLRAASLFNWSLAAYCLLVLDDRKRESLSVAADISRIAAQQVGYK